MNHCGMKKSMTGYIDILMYLQEKIRNIFLHNFFWRGEKSNLVVNMRLRLMGFEVSRIKCGRFFAK